MNMINRCKKDNFFVNNNVSKSGCATVNIYLNKRLLYALEGEIAKIATVYLTYLLHSNVTMIVTDNDSKKSINKDIIPHL